MDDRALVALISRKDPQGLDGAYRRYADRLYTYARGLLGDREAAADVVHDTFLLASDHVTQLRDPDRLCQWLYAIARNEGMRYLRRRAKHAPLEEAPEIVAESADPDAAAHATDVARLVRAAMRGLSDGDREIAELALRHGLSAPDIASVLNVSVNNAHARLSRAREQLNIALGVLVVARDNECPELTQVLGDWDGKLTPLLRKRAHRHIEACDVCSDSRRTRLRPAALLAAYGLLPFAAMPDWTRTSASQVPLKWDRTTGFPAASSTLPAIAAAATVIAILGGAGTWAMLRSDSQPPPVTPIVATSSSAPAPPSPTPSPSISPSASPSPSLSPSPSKSSPKPSPKPPPPLAFSPTVNCSISPSYEFALTVSVQANADLATATLTYRPSTNGTRPMTVSGKTARATATGLSSTKQVHWWVEVKAKDGRTLRGPDTVTHCQ